MTNDADNFREMLSAYMDGELNEADSRRLELAMQKDASLAAELAKLRKVVFMLRHMEREKAGEDFASRVMARAELANLVGGSSQARNRAARPSLMLKWGAMAAAAVICIGIAALVYSVVHPNLGAAGAAKVALNDHKNEASRSGIPARHYGLQPVTTRESGKDAAIEHRAAGADAPLAKASAQAGEAGRRGEEADAQKPMKEEKGGVVLKPADDEKLGKGQSVDSYQVASDGQDKGATEVLYTTNLDEARKNVEQVLAGNGLNTDTSTINAAGSQFYNHSRINGQATSGANQAFGNVSQAPGNSQANVNNQTNSNSTQIVGNTGQTGVNLGKAAGDKIDGIAQTNNLTNNTYANGNFQAVQNSDKQVQYRVMANRAQLPQIRNQLSQLRRTSNFNATVAGSPPPTSQPGDRGRQAGNDKLNTCKNGPQVAGAKAEDFRAPAAPGGTAHGAIAQRQPSAQSPSAPLSAVPTARATAPAEQREPEQKELARREEKILAPTSQMADEEEAKKLAQSQPVSGRQAKDNESLEPLLITINVVAPDKEANAATQKAGEAPASSPATNSAKRGY